MRASFTGSGYPAPFDEPCAARARQRLGDAAGLTDFWRELLRLPAGAWSSQGIGIRPKMSSYMSRRRSSAVTDSGEETLRGRRLCRVQGRAARRAPLANRSSRGSSFSDWIRKVADDEGDYPDIDLRS